MIVVYMQRKGEERWDAIDCPLMVFLNLLARSADDGDELSDDNSRRSQRETAAATRTYKNKKAAESIRGSDCASFCYAR